MAVKLAPVVLLAALLALWSPGGAEAVGLDNPESPGGFGLVSLVPGQGVSLHVVNIGGGSCQKPRPIEAKLLLYDAMGDILAQSDWMVLNLGQSLSLTKSYRELFIDGIAAADGMDSRMQLRGKVSFRGAFRDGGACTLEVFAEDTGASILHINPALAQPALADRPQE
jgi:hypothetical protein